MQAQPAENRGIVILDRDGTINLVVERTLYPQLAARAS